MSGDTYDVQGEVRDALSTAVNSYGKRVLSDPRVLGNLVADLLPDNPRERSLLGAVARNLFGMPPGSNIPPTIFNQDTII